MRLRHEKFELDESPLWAAALHSRASIEHRCGLLRCPDCGARARAQLPAHVSISLATAQRGSARSYLGG
jgi:hypothetical protein